MALLSRTVDASKRTADTIRFTADGAPVQDAETIGLRFVGLIPRGWFTTAPAGLRDAVLGGIGDALAFAHGLVIYGKRQARIRSATGFMLDLTAFDYFGARFLRRRGEGDDPWRARILKELLRPRSTRAAIIGALKDGTGVAPKLYEPWNPGDCGAIGVGTFALAGGKEPEQASGWGTPLGGWGVGAFAMQVPSGPYGSAPGAGCWGSTVLPAQIFVQARRGAGAITDAAGVGGWGVGPFALAGGLPDASDSATGAGFWIGPEQGVSITDAEIYATLAATKAAGVVAWATID